MEFDLGVLSPYEEAPRQSRIRQIHRSHAAHHGSVEGHYQGARGGREKAKG